MKKLLLIFVFLLLCLSKAQSTHIVAADLTYECLGGLSYRTNLTLYRDCGGIPMGVFQMARYSSSSCGSTGNIFLMLDTSYEVSQVCDSLIPQTTCSGGVLPGIEVYVFTAIVTLPSHCPDWTFSFDECCRSTSITNLSPGFRFYTKTTLDNTIDSCNSSPVFKSIPVLYSCLNETVSFNNIAEDPEGDSLSFHMVRTMAANGTNIPYSPLSQTATNPFPTGGGILFDSLTGQMTFVSTTMQQAISTILIKEYDSLGNVKGTHLRDIEFIFINCPPPRFNPYTTGINYDSTNYTYRGCYNEPFCFDVMSVSYDTANPMELNYYGGLPNATFTKWIVDDTTFGQFCWTPDSTNVGNFYFSIEAIAKTCPLKRKNFFNYHIIIDTVFNGCVDTTLILPTTGFVVVDSAMVYDNFVSGQCPLQRIDISKDSFFCSDVGINNVTITAYYQNGDVKTCNSVVTIVDTISPIVGCVDTSIYISAGGNFRIDSSFIFDYRVVSCGTNRVTIDKSNFDCRDLGPTSVELILTEQSGLSDTCYGTVTLIDTFPPTAVCQNTTVYLNSFGIATIDSSDIDNRSYDNCRIVKMWLSKETFGCNDIGSNTVWLYVEDYFGLVDSCQASVTVIDTIGPIINCIDTTVYLSASGSFGIDSSFVVSVLGDTCGFTTITLSRDSFDCNSLGRNSVTVIATDEKGDVDSCSAIVTVLDTLSPVAICQNITLQLPISGQIGIDSSFINNGSYDNCTITRITLSRDSFDCSDVGNNTISMTVIDGEGNSSSCIATVTIVDTVPPVPTCQNVTTYLDATGNSSIMVSQVNNSSTDNCGIDSLWLDKYNFNCSEVGLNSVSLFVRDVSGNIGVCTSTVTVIDTVSPVLSCNDTIVYLNGAGLFVIDTSYVLSSISSGCAVSSVTLSRDTFSCNDLGINQLTITAIDANGNSDSCTSNVSVLDTISPTAICQAITSYLDATGNSNITVAQINNGSYDNCAVDSIWLDKYTFSCSDVGNNSVALFVRDINGNIGTCATTVLVQDTISPVVNCKDTSIYVSANGTFVIDTSFLIGSISSACPIASVTLSNDSFACTNIGNNVVTITVTDVHGNSGTCSSNVLVRDTTSPAAICQNITIYLSQSGIVTIDSSDINNGSFDNCQIATISLSQNTFDCSHIGINTVQMIVTDVYGNSSSCSSAVQVLDTISPIASCQNTTVYLNTLGQVTIDSSNINNGSSDNCAIATIQVFPQFFDCSDLGANSVIMVVTDVNGNRDSCSSVVTVVDTIPPAPNCSDTTIYLDSLGSFTITTAYLENGSSDFCGIDSIWLSKYNFNCFELGSNAVTLYARDSSQNIDSCVSIVTVLDTTNPMAICQDTTIYLNNSGFFVIDSSYINNNPAYGCDISTIKLDKDTFDCSAVGINSVQMIVTDRNGNSDTCSAVVTVIDSIRPTAICQNVTLYLPAIGGLKIDSSYLNNGSFDNCAIASISISKDSFDCSSVGINSVTMTVTDANGNSDSCSATVTVIDSISPIVFCQDTTIYLDQFGKINIDSSFVYLGSSDNCGIRSISVLKDSFDCSEIGSNSVSILATDVNGNTAMCTSIVTVLDTLLPVAQAGPDTTVCGSVSMTLNGSPVIPGQIGYWSSLPSASALTISAPNNPRSSVTGLGNGVYSLVWNVSNGVGCRIDRDTIEIISLLSLNATASPDVQLCNQYSVNVVATPVPNGIQGSWSVGSGAPSLPTLTSSVPHNLSIANLVEGSYSFIWKVSNNVCPDAFDTVLIDVYDEPTAQVGPDQLLCGKYSTTLTGNIPNGSATGKWSLLSTRTGAVVLPTIQNDTLGNTLVTGFVEGSYLFVWTVSNGVCSPKSDTLIVSVYDQPIASAMNDTLLCGVDSVLLFATPPVGLASGLWSLDSAVTMTPKPVMADSTSETTMANGLQLGGSQQFIWSVSNGVCPISRDTVFISVLERPIVDAGNDTSLCSQYTFNLDALPINQPATGFWTIDTAFSPNIPLISNPSNPKTSVSGLIEGVYRFIWRGQNLPCYDISDTVVISIFDQYSANVGPDMSFCDEDSVKIVANAVSGLASAQWVLASSFPNTPRYDSLNSISYVSNMVPGGTYSLVWEVRNGVCPISRDTLQIINNYVPNASFVESKRELCEEGEVTFFTIAPSGLPYTVASRNWKIGSATYSGTPITHTFNSAGLYDVQYIVSATNGCSDTAFKSNWITVHENPIADFEAQTNIDRNNSLAIGIIDYSQFASNYLYKFGDGNSSTYSEPTHSYTDSGFYSIWQIVSTDFGCMDSTMRTIFVKELSAFVPSAFTPNNDGNNDVFSPVITGNDPSVYSLVIFNRWGEVVFETSEMTSGWDGSHQGIPSEVGVYVWQLVYKDENSTKTINKRGHLNLIR